MAKTQSPSLKFCKEWMHASDVMLFLKISRTTLHRMCESGQLPYSCLGNIKLFPVEVLDKLLHHNLRNKPLRKIDMPDTDHF